MKIWEIFRLFISFEITKKLQKQSYDLNRISKKEMEEKYNFIFERILIKCYLYKHLNHWKFLIDLSISLNEVYLYVSNIDLKFISSIQQRCEFSISRSIFWYILLNIENFFNENTRYCHDKWFIFLTISILFYQIKFVLYQLFHIICFLYYSIIIRIIFHMFHFIPTRSVTIIDQNNIYIYFCKNPDTNLSSNPFWSS